MSYSKANEKWRYCQGMIIVSNEIKMKLPGNHYIYVSMYTKRYTFYEFYN